MANVKWQRADGKDKTIQIKVYDIYGKEIKADVIRNSDGFVIRRSNLAAGIYIYEIINDEGVIGKGKLIVVE